MATGRASRTRPAEALATNRGRPRSQRPSGSEQAEPRPCQPTGSVFGGSSEVGALARAVLLGAVVGSVTVFLLYPNIARLVARLPFSPSALPSPSSSAQPSSSPSPSDDPADVSLAREKRESDTKRTVSNADRTPSTLRQTSGLKTNIESLPSDHCESDECIEAEVEQGRSSNRQAISKKTLVHGDLMEGEEDDDEVVEFIVEEDPADLQLMDVGEDVEYIDLKDDGETDPPHSMSEKPDLDLADESPSKSRENVRETRREFQTSNLDLSEHSQGWDQEPITVKDGQTITFTPVSPGDENTIRIGGRKRPNIQKIPSLKEPLDSLDLGIPTQAKTAYKTETASREEAKEKKSGAEKLQKKSSSKGDKLKTASQKTQDKRSANSKSQSKASGSGNDSSRDLPEEVRNFQPTYLKTVTAKKIFADGRRIPPVELLPQRETNSSVRVYLFNDFLSVEECDGLRRVHDKHVKDVSAPPLLCFSNLATLRKHLQDVNSTVHVTPNDFIEGTRCVNESFSRRLARWLSGNWSYSTAFYPGESRFSDVFAGRVQQAMGLDPRHGGKFQITSYPEGKAYKAHTDCVLDNQDQRDRVATVLVYLDDVEDGGETKFPDLGIWVKPRKGRALVWNNMSPEGVCEPHSLHVASKVNKGSKYILIRWYYYKSFYSLGKRPPEPPIPARPPGTPRVSCDDYDNGSCRWYDEWNMDHLLDYEAKKYTLV